MLVRLNALLFSAALLLAGDYASAQAKPQTRYFSGGVEDQAALIILEFGSPGIEPSPKTLYAYNVHGSYVLLTEERPTPRYLQGRWDPPFLGLESYRVQYHDFGSTRTREQLGFLAADIGTGWGASTDMSGTWIETKALSAGAFYTGREYVATRRSNASFREGGQPTIQSLSGRYTCTLPNQSLNMSLEDGRITSLAIAQRDPNPPFRTCELRDRDLGDARGSNSVMLAGKPGHEAFNCTVSILDLGRRILVSAEPWNCNCRSRIVLDKQSGACFDLFTNQSMLRSK